MSAPPCPVRRGCPRAGTCRAASSGSEPAAPASVRRSRPSDPAPVPQASAPRRMTRCPRRSLRPPRQSRRFGEHASRLPRESPRATPCRSANETSGRVLPWLSHVIRSGVSEPSLTLSGSRQWSRLPSFPHRSRTRAPSLHRRYPASAVIQAPPPPCRPGLPLTGFRLARGHATDRVSRVATVPLFHACRRQYPGGVGRCARRSLPGRCQPSPLFGGSAPALHVSRPARRSLALRPTWSLSRPGRPVAPECFSRSRYLLQPLRLLPAGATVAGRGSHPLGDGTFPRRTNKAG